MHIGGKLESSLTRSTNAAVKSLDSIKKSASMVKGAVTAALGAVSVHQVVEFGQSCAEAAANSQSVVTQLNAVLASTKGVSGMTAKAAQDLSTSLQSVTTYDDETILSAENLLLTFTKIGKDVFPDATEAVLNMSTALGQDTKSSSIQLGKALQDPIKGVTALRKVGIMLTDAQTKQIKAMVKAGNIAGAQKVILKELSTEFGGSAVAAANTYTGSIEQMKNAWDDLKEKIGGGVLPTVTTVMKSLAGLFNGTVSPEQFGDQISQTINDVMGKSFDLLPTAFKTGAQILSSVGKGIMQNLPQRIPGIVQGVMKAFSNGLKHTSELIRTALVFIKEFGDGLLKSLPELTKEMPQIVTGIANALTDNKMLEKIINAGIQLLGQLASNVTAIISSISAVLPSIVEQVGDALTNESNLKMIVDAGVDLFVAIANNTAEIVAMIADKLPAIVDGIAKALTSEENLNKMREAGKKLLGAAADIISMGTGGFLPGSSSQKVYESGTDREMVWSNTEKKYVYADSAGSTTDVPKYASGGFVRHRPGGILANIGEGRYDEAVVPLNGAGGLGNFNPTYAPTIYIQGSASKEDVKQALSESQAEWERHMSQWERTKRRVGFSGN